MTTEKYAYLKDGSWEASQNGTHPIDNLGFHSRVERDGGSGCGMAVALFVMMIVGFVVYVRVYCPDVNITAKLFELMRAIVYAIAY